MVMIRKTLFIKLAVSTKAIRTVFATEVDTNQNPIYFISKVLTGPKMFYLKIEKMTLDLVIASRKP